MCSTSQLCDTAVVIDHIFSGCYPDTCMCVCAHWSAIELKLGGKLFCFSPTVVTTIDVDTDRTCARPWSLSSDTLIFSCQSAFPVKPVFLPDCHPVAVLLASAVANDCLCSTGSLFHIIGQLLLSFRFVWPVAIFRSSSFFFIFFFYQVNSDTVLPHPFWVVVLGM